MYNMNVRRRFHSHVKYNKGMYDGCWVWTGMLDKDGYGSMKIGGKKVNARRLSWELHYGSIPEGMYVYRSCKRHHTCVNPNHLFISTPSDYKDTLYLQHPNTIHLSRFVTLCEEEVFNLLFAASFTTRKQLQGQFGISKVQLDRILDSRKVYHKQHYFEPGGTNK